MEFQKNDNEFDLRKKSYTNLMRWANQTIFDEADGLISSEIFAKYDNIPIPIAVLPSKALNLFKNISDINIYSGKAYFIDHMVNHHSELDISEYQNFQNDLDNFDKAYLDPKNESVVFEKNKNNRKYSIAVKEEENGKIVFYKSYHYGNKTKKRFIELDLDNSEQNRSVESGKISISHSDNSESGRPLSALTDTKNISQKTKKSNTLSLPLKIEVNGKERTCQKGLLEGFKNAVTKLDNLTHDYNELVENYKTVIKERNELQEKLFETKINKNEGIEY